MKKPVLVIRVMTIVLAVSLALPLFAATVSAAGQPVGPSSAMAASWLLGQQQASGGFAGLTGKADSGTTADAVVALAAAGRNPAMAVPGKKSAIAYLDEQAPAYAKTEAGAVKLLLAAVAAGVNPRDFGGVDLIQAVQNGYQSQSGMFDQQLFIHADAVLALAAAGVTVPKPAIDALLKAQAPDGGWAYTGSTQAGQADSNTSALVLQALEATHAATPKVVERALSYLRTTQAGDGGFAYQPPVKGTPFASDANSTAYVVQAIIATGQDPNSVEWHQAVDALQKFRNSDGALRYQLSSPADNLLATLQAIPALGGKALPVRSATPISQTAMMQSALSPAKAAAGCRYFPQTRHNVCANFLTYWSKFGGLATYGYPISETFTEHGLTVQYFQRARFELHLDVVPQRDHVLLGLLGDETHASDSGATARAFAAIPSPTGQGCRYFSKTSHDICGPFAAYWQKFGGLLTFGYPISQPFSENGDTVQYFERTRFELKPGSNEARLNVVLPLIGNTSLAERH